MAQYCDNFKFSENNQDHFVMGPVSNDTFQFWQGLRGPYFTPSVGDDGYLYWTNNGQLPNPEPVKIVGKDGRGITLTGQCATVAELPEDPEQGEAWAVGAEEPFECYAWFGEWVDMGLLFPAGQDGVSPAVTITTTATGHKVKITDRDHQSGQEFNVDDGEDGDPGQDGISPTVTITTTATGHKVKITDRDHPSGQEFNVDDGEDGDPGPGVPAGGSAGQFYRKASGTDYDGEWHTLSAGDSSYDSSLTYSSGTVGKELSDQKNTLNHLEDGLAIIVNGDTCTTAVPVGGYAYIKNNTHGLAEGLYTNTSASVFPTSGGTADGTVFTAVSGGGLNSLKNSLLTSYGTLSHNSTYIEICYVYWTRFGNIVTVSGKFATGNTGVPVNAVPFTLPYTPIENGSCLIAGYDNYTRVADFTTGNKNVVIITSGIDANRWARFFATYVTNDPF